jgi:hypothetical protein
MDQEKSGNPGQKALQNCSEPKDHKKVRHLTPTGSLLRAEVIERIRTAGFIGFPKSEMVQFFIFSVLDELE